MSYRFRIPARDAAANDVMQRFLQGATLHFSTLGYDVSDLDQVVTAAGGFNTAYQASESARLAYRNAVAQKDLIRNTSEDVIRVWAQRVKSNPAASPAILVAFGFEPGSSAAGPVQPPSELSAAPAANGSCLLRWKPNGNIRVTIYNVEVSVAGGEWQILASTPRRRYVDTTATPGVPRTYRVRATRNGALSQASAEASIYTEPGGGEIHLAA